VREIRKTVKALIYHKLFENMTIRGAYLWSSGCDC